jgi:hypothetical protein
MELLKWFRQRKAESLRRAQQKVTDTRRNVDLSLKVENWQQGFGPNPFQTEEDREYKAGFMLNDDDEPRGDW